VEVPIPVLSPAAEAVAPPFPSAAQPADPMPLFAATVGTPQPPTVSRPEVDLEPTTEQLSREEDWVGALDSMAQLRRGLSDQLLTAQQEIALARRIRGQDVVVPGPGRARPTPEEAEHRLVEQNLRLVMWVANRYRNRGLSPEDLIQEGAIGLQRAARRFDPERGCRFATYAVWWIKQAIAQALADGAHAIRVPEGVLDRIAEVRAADRRLRLALGRAPTSEEVGAALGLTARDVEQALTAISAPVSLDQPVDEDGLTVGEMVADDDPTPEEQIAAGSLSDDVALVLARLPEDERRVLSLRYGLCGTQPRTVVEVGGLLGISRERVYRLEGQALQRLRRDRSVLRLRAYLA
jgi:RNA polymerase sigma factor (sigma-70 family)